MNAVHHSVNPAIKVCVTGASGFLGRAIVNKLANSGYQVLALSRDNSLKTSDSRIEHISGNIEKWEHAIAMHLPQFVISCDWTGVSRDSRDDQAQEDNLVRVLRIARQALNVNAKAFLTFGSQAEVAPSQEEISEGIQDDPQNTYGEVKIRLRKQLEKLTSGTKTRFIWGRVFTIYGPGDRRDSIITDCINSAFQEKSVSIRNPQVKWSFLYVDDFTEAIVDILENDAVSGTINIGNPSGEALENVGKIISALLLDVPNESSYSNENSNIKSITWIPNVQTLSNIGWKPLICLPDGLAKTVEWWRMQIQNG
jgi:dTDP-6-deoxy-L-talose 4-dehydrogenase (NAD+)